MRDRRLRTDGSSPVRWTSVALLVLCTVLLAVGPACADEDAGPRPLRLWLPTAQPSGNPINDRVWVDLYTPEGPTPGPVPVVILLHMLGTQENAMMSDFARYLARRQIAAVTMDLPWHLRRKARGEEPFRHYIAQDYAKAIQAFGQAGSDVRTVVDWLSSQSNIDSRRIAVAGVSLGAIISHLAMGLDSRLSAGVAILGGADLPDLSRRSILFGILYLGRSRTPTAAERRRIASVDPLTYAGNNRPRRVFMVQAARDMLVLPSGATALWEALGRPPIRWLDTNHYGPAFGLGSLLHASVSYLRNVWSGRPDAPIPPIWAPTLKVGLLSGLDSKLTPALTWQAVTLVSQPNHMSLLHLDLGYSGRGPFVGLALTLNAFMDVGVAERIRGHGPRGYVSFHIVF